MLFLHVLLFFSLGPFTAAVPIVSTSVSLHPRGSCISRPAGVSPDPGGTKEPCIDDYAPLSLLPFDKILWKTWGTISSLPQNHDIENTQQLQRRATGYWYCEFISVSEYCSFSRLICTMHLIYLHRLSRRSCIPM